MSFKADLEFEKEQMQKLVESLPTNCQYHIMQGNFKYFDLVIVGKETGKIKTAEVKFDRLAHKTGNFAIELSCGGKPSGISSTKADLFLLVDANSFEVYPIPTEQLKGLLGPLKRVMGGDGWKSEIALLPVDVLAKEISK